MEEASKEEEGDTMRQTGEEEEPTGGEGAQRDGERLMGNRGNENQDAEGEIFIITRR